MIHRAKHEIEKETKLACLYTLTSHPCLMLTKLCGVWINVGLRNINDSPTMSSEIAGKKEEFTDPNMKLKKETKLAFIFTLSSL